MTAYRMTTLPIHALPQWYQWMHDVQNNMEDSTQFVLDPMDYIIGHLENGGFGIQTLGPHGERMGCLLCCVPHTPQENLGRTMFGGSAELDSVIHIEYTAVAADCRGHRLQEKMIARAELMLKQSRFRHMFATASPDNPASVRSFLHQGFEIAETKELYGGLMRHIFYKPIPKETR